MFKKIFGKKKQQKIDELEEISYEKKSEFMKSILGPELDMVMHAIIPYDAGGSLDLYYFTDFHEGTAVATKELTNYEFTGPSNDYFDAYELIMCSDKKIDIDSVKVENPEKGTFAYDHRNINSILNIIARYSSQAKLNPYETIEFPEDMEFVGGKCLILDKVSEPFTDEITKQRKFGVMLIIEIHRSEMEYAMNQKGKELIDILKGKGVYPFSIMDRKPVV